MKLSQRIVVIDDEGSVRSGLTNLLQSEGYLTRSFASAEALLCDRGALEDAALFIIDVELSGMSGLGLFRELNRQLQNPAGIIISGNGNDEMHREAIALGAMTFMQKPIDIDVLFEQVRQAFSTRTARL